MLVLLRIALTGAFVWLLWSASVESSANLENDVVNAGRFALAIVVGFAAALTWAPLFGELIAGPVTGLMNDGSVSGHNPWLVRKAQAYAYRGRRRLAVLLSFIAGVLRPNLPAPFVVGMDNSRPGSWLELAFAREVWRFNNVANCIRAHDLMVLNHDVKPPAHPVPEITLALLAHVRPPHETPEDLPLPPAPPPPPLQRNPRIRIFDGPVPSGEVAPHVTVQTD